MFIIQKKTTLFMCLIGTMSTTHTAVILPLNATALASALLCSAAARTAAKIIRQASNNSGITVVIEDSQLFTTKTMHMGPLLVQVNPRKFFNRTLLAASLLALARTTGTTLTPATIYTIFGVAAGSAMSIGS